MDFRHVWSEIYPMPFLSAKEKLELKSAHRKCKDKRIADRIKGILLLEDGYPVSEISRILLWDEDTIRRWKGIYDAEGLEGLQKDYYEGGKSMLCKAELEELEKYLVENTMKSAKEICFWVNQRFGVKYSTSGMRELLHRLGFTYKKSKIVPGKADPEKQKKFIAEYTKLKENIHQKMKFSSSMECIHC